MFDNFTLCIYLARNKGLLSIELKSIYKNIHSIKSFNESAQASENHFASTTETCVVILVIVTYALQNNRCTRVSGCTMLNVCADFISACEALLFEDDNAVNLPAYKRLKHA